MKIFGPGVITGAADDDPSGIATYSQTGAQFGFGQLWTSFYQIPLMLAVQEACARIGSVTGMGLAGVIRQHYSRRILMAVVLLIVGLWHATLTLSEKGFYAMSFTLSLFAAIAVQKNTRDNQRPDDNAGNPATRVTERPRVEQEA